MEAKDINLFKELINQTSDLLQQKEPLSGSAINMFFNLLSDYSYEQVDYAIHSHLKSRTGQFMPRPADIFRHLEGAEISPDEVIAAAILKKTPFGVLAAIEIGSFDLKNGSSFRDTFYLKKRAEYILQLLPEWKKTQAKGIYSDHEMLTLIKYDVKPNAPFIGNMPPPINRDVLKEQYLRVKGSPEFKALIDEREAIEEEVNIEGQKRIAETLKLLSPKKDESN